MHQDPQQPYRGPYPPPPHGHIVTRSGLSSGAHTAHAIMTVISCGFWSPIWILHTLLAKRKTTTRY